MNRSIFTDCLFTKNGIPQSVQSVMLCLHPTTIWIDGQEIAAQDHHGVENRLIRTRAGTDIYETTFSI